VPRVTVSETYTDNVRQVETGATSELITEIAPGVRIDASSARLSASLDYGLSENLYARGTSPRRSVQSLNGSGLFEAIDKFAYVDFNANVSQQRVSAFGPQAQGNFNLNGNTAETRTFGVSPFVRGRLGSIADYQLRYSATRQSADTTQNNETTTDQWTGTLSGGSPSGRFAWSLAGATQRARYGDRPSSDSDSATARLNYLADIEYRLWVSAGRERNNYAGGDATPHSTRAVGLDWTPGPRTSVSVSRERRFFGDSDNVSISHRTSRALLKMSHGTSVSVIPNQVGATLVSNYDYYYALFGQIEPYASDPILRAAATNQLLRQNNLQPNAPGGIGLFLAQRVSVQRRSEVALVLTGVRNTLTMTGTRGTSRSLFDGVLGDDFDSSSEIRENSASATWGHQLSPASSVSVSAVRSESSASTSSGQSTTSRTINGALSTKLGATTGLSLSLSRTEAQGSSSAYTANTAIATISHTF
jgi:uncharacterized protein (PEP-CTERM system associated)